MNSELKYLDSILVELQSINKKLDKMLAQLAYQSLAEEAEKLGL